MFGHVLGLYHPPTASNDLMSGGFFDADVPFLPSTLDLYGVYVLKTGASMTSATLPNNIPYTTAPAQALPEFPVMPLTIFSLGALLVLLKARDRKRQPEHR